MPNNPNAKANLKPFPPGNKANPNGRPKKLPELDTLITEILGSPEDKKSGAYAILEAMLKKAKRGDVKAADLLLNRAYGKVADKLDVKADVNEVVIFKLPDNGRNPG